MLMKNHPGLPVNPSWFLESENALSFYTEICHKCKSSLCTNDTSNNLQNPRGQFLGIEFQVTNQTLTRVKSFKNITNYIIKSTYYERNEQYSKTFFVHEIINY